jgi:hypothetical protein
MWLVCQYKTTTVKVEIQYKEIEEFKVWGGGQLPAL